MNTKTNEQDSKLLESNFSDIGVSPNILKILDKLSLTSPTPIQKQAIPVALKGTDIVGIAQTGTGKTFAFGIPIIQKLLSSSGQALVLVPTRELALQVNESIRKLADKLNISTIVLIGGENISRQFFELKRRPRLIIATPGRLIDHLKRKSIKLDQIKTLVLDEADMMLDMGFLPQIEEILRSVPKERQTMLFSATMPVLIANLATKYLKLPIRIEVAPQGTIVKNVTQEMIVLEAKDKMKYLEKIIKENEGSILIFVRTRYGVKNIARKLISNGHKATEIHSDLSQGQRKRALDSFKSGRSRIMVATDVAARGLDVKGIELVINYDLPDSSSDYVHRIGRTARAGKKGKAISLATPGQLKNIKAIEALIKMRFNIVEQAKLEPVYTRKRSFHSKRY
ncbi:MAG TPA: DEAD/DEAH box helicase [Candidatus Pacearchaeota archaeon]|nr:DEAD/DEAH box helicase [Candidatus Pacearchaeota archaeon]HOS12553.1 DEAD/DEAH box helicase [Candidatus Pacearchaeota archaeon]HRT18366.1 DEAD/DEAH box helicase [Candidatus Paceibacterota bacterium]